MKSLLDVIKASTAYLEKHNVTSARLQAEELIAAALRVKRLDLYLSFDRPLSESELAVCREYLKRRAQREPLQYIVGDVDFFNCLIKVTPQVLIPRPETEQLVEKIARELQNESLKGKHLWDVCCGSGCIGIALKKQFPDLAVTSTDFSEGALNLARANAELNEVDITYLQGDFLTPLEGMKAHYVVCNPPYISDEEYSSLEVDVRDYEPKSALVAEDNGLYFYNKLAMQLKKYLNSSAKVWLEIGFRQGEDVKKIFRDAHWDTFSLIQDYAGIDRFLKAEQI